MTARKEQITRKGSRAVSKGKRTFSLSTASLAYLETLASNYRSTSEALEALIQEKQEVAEKARISAGIQGYYDSIGEDERAENLAWGEFVHAHLPTE